MARFANIRPEQINKARRMLQDLPEKIERKTRQEAALLLERDLPKELCTLLKNEGIIIPTYLIRQFCSENDESLSEPSLDIVSSEGSSLPTSEDAEHPEQPEVVTGMG